MSNVEPNIRGLQGESPAALIIIMARNINIGHNKLLAQSTSFSDEWDGNYCYFNSLASGGGQLENDVLRIAFSERLFGHPDQECSVKIVTVCLLIYACAECGVIT